VKLILCSFYERLLFFNHPSYFLDFGSDTTVLLKLSFNSQFCLCRFKFLQRNFRRV